MDNGVTYAWLLTCSMHIMLAVVFLQLTLGVLRVYTASLIPRPACIFTLAGCEPGIFSHMRDT